MLVSESSSPSRAARATAHRTMVPLPDFWLPSIASIGLWGMLFPPSPFGHQQAGDQGIDGEASVTHNLFLPHVRPLLRPHGGFAADDRSDLGPEQFDSAQHFVVRHRADGQLQEEPLIAEELVLVEDLVDHLLWAADQQGAAWPTFSLEPRPG